MVPADGLQLDHQQHRTDLHRQRDGELNERHQGRVVVKDGQHRDEEKVDELHTHPDFPLLCVVLEREAVSQHERPSRVGGLPVPMHERNQLG